MGSGSEGRTLRCELGSDGLSGQMEVFRTAQHSFDRYLSSSISLLCDVTVMSSALSVLSAAPPAAGLSVSDQDSGVEDEDLSPRPSPSPHLPAPQVRTIS